MTGRQQRHLVTVFIAVLSVTAAVGCKPSVPPDAGYVGRALVDARTTLRRAAEAEDPLTALYAIKAMTEVALEESGGLFLQALESENHPVVRFAAAMAVGELRYERAKDKLVSMAEDKSVEPDKRVLCAVIYALHRLGVDTFNYALGDLLFDSEFEVRASAAMVMGKMGEPTAKGPLKTLLADEHEPAVKLQIRESLAMLGDSRSRHLLEAYTKGYYLDLRLEAIPALARTDSRRAMYVLRGLLANDRSPRIRAVAAGELARLGEVDEAGYSFCLDAVRNPRRIMQKAYGGARKVSDIEAESLQRLAAMSLGNMRRRGAVGVLQPLLKSPDGGVRVAAAMAIIKLLAPEQKQAPKAEPEEKETTTKPAPEPPKVKLHTAGGKD
ncbi:MAG: HEAT repeat domain-containing protein [Planctomycetota bacterium]|jgi:HEAT repeat protein